MRLLVCQTPKLSYSQMLELLQHETEDDQYDLACFPEICVDHPPQCTGQGALSLENVALRVLAQLAKNKKMYIVLGSVEEKVDGKCYDTCVVLDRSGEICLTYRKQSTSSVTKAVGNEMGIFHTEQGPIGILLSSEVEEKAKWMQILEQKPYFVLNPARAPCTADPFLLNKYPELQVKAWHAQLAKIEKLVTTMTRYFPCSFVRVDAPHLQGGSGTSLLFEPHRSFIAPRATAVIFSVETLHPNELPQRRLPGWRALTIEDRALALERHSNGGAPAVEATSDEALEKGPRYLVWTMRPPHKGMAKRGPTSGSARQRSEGLVNDMVEHGLPFSQSIRNAFQVPLRARTGEALFLYAEAFGRVILWDVALKNDRWSHKFPQSQRITAAAGWEQPWQYIIATVDTSMNLLFTVFDQETILRTIPINFFSTVVGTVNTNMDNEQSQQPSSDGPPNLKGRARAAVRFLHYVSGTLVLAVLEGAPVALLTDIETQTSQEISIHGGPPNERARAELVGTHLIKQRFRERSTCAAVACLYRSNHLCHVSLDDMYTYDQTLIEDAATVKQRSDIPLHSAAVQYTGYYHLIVTYQSMTLRWWQVSLNQCKLQTHTILSSAMVHLTAIYWGPSPSAGLGQPVAAAPPTAASTTRTSASASQNMKLKSASQSASSPARQSRKTMGVRKVRPTQAGEEDVNAEFPGIEAKLNEHRAQRGSIIAEEVATMPASEETQDNADSGYMPPDICICIIGIDANGAMPLLFARGGRITRVYQCSDHFVEKSVEVERIYSEGKDIAVMLSNGDIRFFEFYADDEVMALQDLQFEA
eukprot:gnl/MRDRNA2_/MRDRNA2_93333_c0_seq1.p1 gnl/MRDRNA2_/MRDRNA2_93333_c0~~gnl/MRDRNA2_/MRDRNA2_93333_c0_seq1.p1  ORF type:complete len:815 (+),score=151.82 gnl/MRDRNA2_/MRDRNA2_93333_c0_seq1:221-2665(+)